jgi:murein DD-endopeptidase MepM/ murein hydrolase activator NlpD
VNRIGWAVFLVLVLLGLGFVIMQAPGTGIPSQSTPTPPVTASADAPSDLAMPVAGVAPAALVDSWHEQREGGARQHEALDIPAPGGTPVLAAASGNVEKLFTSAQGGTTAYVRIANGAWMTYYAHLSAYAPGLAEGQAVARGQTIGFVGDTGNAGPGNTHLHFALHRMAPGEKWFQGTPVDPFPILHGPLLAEKPSAR